jgi:hypothetical protein
MVHPRLQEIGFRFALVAPNSKIPCERHWNTDNSYPYFHSKLLAHQGNYTVCCGYNNLIVIDFDDFDFWRKYEHRMPITFTVRTAKKGMFHLYYILDGEMFKKVAVQQQGKVLCDIQADRSGVVGPGSMIDGKRYEVIRDMPITHINRSTIEGLFGFKGKIRHEYKVTDVPQPEKVNIALNALKLARIERAGELRFRCPFHESNGKGGNLAIMPSGSLFCHHCQSYWSTIHKFIDELNDFRRLVI